MRAAVMLLALASGLPAQDAASIVVRVYAYTPAPLSAAREGEEIFRRAGVETRWTACTPARGDCGELREGEILLKVVPRPWRRGPGAMAFGTAVVDRHSYLGWVFLDRVEQAARANAASAGTVLAHVMAHEVAHLLGLKHSEHGIMRADYDGAEIRAAETGALVFTAEEAAELRDAAIRRQNRQFASTSGPPSPLP